MKRRRRGTARSVQIEDQEKGEDWSKGGIEGESEKYCQTQGLQPMLQDLSPILNYPIKRVRQNAEKGDLLSGAKLGRGSIRSSESHKSDFGVQN